MVPCPSLSSPANPLRGSGVSDRSRCGAVPILERFRRRGEGGGGERGEEGGGRRREGAGSREEEGGGRREEGGGRREEGEEQAAHEVGRELLLDGVEEAVALGHRRVVGEVPGVERREVVAAQIAPVRFRLGVGVAGELERGVREDGVDHQGRPRQERLDHWGRHVGAHQGLEASVGADRRVSACAWVRKPAPAMASSISVWVRELAT